MNNGSKLSAKLQQNKKEMVSTSPISSGSNGSMTRAQRNQAEKQRRDKLNAYISELATIVPMVAMASKRLDKTSILRLSAAHLRIYQSILGGKLKKPRSHFKWRPNYINSDKVQDLLEAVDGFVIVMTDAGKIIFVSQSIDRYLGHQQIEVIGHSFYSFIHPLDCDTVKQQMQNLNTQMQDSKEKVSSRCSLFCRMRERGQPRSEVVTYQLVHMVGHLTLCPASSTPTSSKDLLLLKSFIRLVHSSPYTELTLSDAIEDEYTTRHNIDGTIIFADHRLSTITGHLPYEVTKFSAYNYILPEDRPVALFAHKQMFTSSTGTGMIVYRLRTQNNSKVYLKSMGYLQYSSRSADKVDHFLCINKLLMDEEGEKELKKFQDKYTPHINAASLTSLFDSFKNIQNLEFESIMTSFQTQPSKKARFEEASSVDQTSNDSQAPKELGVFVDNTLCGLPRMALPQSMSPLSECGSNLAFTPPSFSNDISDTDELMEISIDPMSFVKNESLLTSPPSADKSDLVSSFSVPLLPGPDLSVPLSFSSQDWCVATLQNNQPAGPQETPPAPGLGCLV